MQVKDLIPWARGGKASEPKDSEGNPIMQLQEEMNRVFENFWNRFDRRTPGVGNAPVSGLGGIGFPWNGGTPSADVVETAEGIEVTVELPGLEQKDVEVTLTDELLTVKGEKKVEREDSKKGYYLSERSYGAFHRAIPLPPGVDSGKAEAVFRNGVLTVKLPQSAEARAKVRRIDVKSG